MAAKDILQKYYARIGQVSEDDKVGAAAEYAGITPAEIKKSPGLLMQMLDILDRPGNATRALLVGKLGGLKGLIPFAKVIEDLTGWDVALNPEDRVTGEEVLEQYTGIKDKKGKFDISDVLGFIIEVVADPLWLLGGIGAVTKVGKAGKIVKATHKAAKAVGSSDDLVRAMAKVGWTDKAIQATVKNTITKDTLRQIHKHFRSGKALPENVSARLIKSFSTLYESGGGKIPKGIFKSKGWAEQAAAGERALLHLGLPGMRKPVIKGVGTLKRLDTIATNIRMGWVGEKFLHTTKRVSTGKQKEFHDITKGMTDAAKYNTQEAFNAIDNIAKDLSTKQLDDLMNHIEFADGIAKANTKLASLELVELNAKTLFLQEDELLKILKEVGVHPDDIKRLTDSRVAKRVATRTGQKSKKLVNQGKLGTFEEGRLLEDTPEELAEIINTVRKNEGKRAASVVKELQEAGIETVEAHVDNLGEVTIRTMNLSDENLKILSKRGDVAIATFEGRKGHYVTFIPDVTTTQIVGIDNAVTKKIVKKYTKMFKADRAGLQNNLDTLLTGYDDIQKQTLAMASGKYSVMFEDILKAEQVRGIATPSLRGRFGYATRWYTQKFRKWHEKKGTINFTHKGKTFSTTHDFQTGRVTGLRDLTRDEIVDLFKSKGFKGEIFENPLATIAERVGKGQKTIGSANAIYDSIARFGKTAGGDGMTSIEKLLKSTKLRPTDEFAAKIAGKNFIDDDIASALTNQFKFSKLDTVETAVNKITKMYKTLLTIPFPAFHTRNFMTATTMNFMDGVVNPRHYRKAVILQTAAAQTRRIARKQGINFAEASKQVKWPKVKTAGGTVDGAVFYTRLEQNRLVGEVAGHFSVAEELNLGGRFSQKTGRRTRGIKERAFAGSMFMENNPRIANVLAHAEGMPLDEAIRNSKMVHFDYSDLSESEKYLRDNVVLFWTFARKNIAAQTKYLHQQPAKMAIFAKLAGGTPDVERRENLPKYMQERIDIPTPFEDEEGRTMNIRGLGLPMEEAFGHISAPGVGIFDRMSRLVSRQLARTVPHIKTPIELATKKNLFFDRDIRNVGEFVGQALPTSRIYNTVQRFGRDDKPDTKALDLLTGIKVTPAYDDFYKYLSEKEKIEGTLKRSPRFKSFTRYYPADKEDATPGEKALLKKLYQRR